MSELPGSSGLGRSSDGDSDSADGICSGSGAVESKSRSRLVWVCIMISNTVASVISAMSGVSSPSAASFAQSLALPVA